MSFAPPSVAVSDDAPDEGEYELPDEPSDSNNVQNVTTADAPKAETPKTPPKVTQPLPKPRTPRPTHVRPPVGYYRALSEGEKASIACENLSNELEEDRPG